ncbi:NapC/NirT family cytochrome c [Fundidesulfovibrio terrae]|uniref:NapC/NirT family cytochrome c n=1 Tax=Fundidesulfovibrio terrae TaxID=2922866 RepID=UPI001FAF4CDB|nr:NapC/NirT family cytochrome c [Fundidesulfovibrio terrae]
MGRASDWGGPRPRKLIAVVCAAAAALFLSVRQGASFLASPSFCSSCHVMSAQYVSHRRSAHQRAPCVDCHTGRGCGSCHDPGRSDAAVAGRAVNAPGPDLHAVHASGPGVACTDCHLGIMHSRIDGYTRESPRASCGKCHGQTALGEGVRPARTGALQDREEL